MKNRQPWRDELETLIDRHLVGWTIDEIAEKPHGLVTVALSRGDVRLITLPVHPANNQIGGEVEHYVDRREVRPLLDLVTRTDLRSSLLAELIWIINQSEAPKGLWLTLIHCMFENGLLSENEKNWLEAWSSPREPGLNR